MAKVKFYPFLSLSDKCLSGQLLSHPGDVYDTCNTQSLIDSSIDLKLEPTAMYPELIYFWNPHL